MNHSWAYTTESYLEEIYTAKIIKQSGVTEMGKAFLASQCHAWQHINTDYLRLFHNYNFLVVFDALIKWLKVEPCCS